MKITLDSRKNRFVLLDEQRQYLMALRKMPGKEWDGKQRQWYAPYVKEVWQYFLDQGWPVEGMVPPRQPGYTVERVEDDWFILVRTLVTPEDVNKCRRIPEFRLFSSKDNAWLCKPTKQNIEYLLKAFPAAVWLGSAGQLKAAAENGLEPKAQVATIATPSSGETVSYVVNDYRFHTTPYDHQLEVFALTREKPVYALLMEQGTGKSKVVIDTAAWLYLQGKIDGLLIVCINGMKDPWIEELEDHMPPDIDVDAFIWEASTRHKIENWIHQRPKGAQPLRVLIMNVEAFSGPKGTEAAALFVAKHACLMAVDESTKIKSPGAKRTKNVTRVGRGAYYRRILSGLPSPQSPLDIYSQARFLDPTLLGHSSYFGFRNTYAIMGGFNGKQVVGYVNLPQLQEKIKTFSYRKLKSECLDLPEKIYEKVIVDMGPEQAQAYQEMRDEMQAEVAGKKMTVTLVLQKMQALARITGGFFSYLGLDEDDLPMRLLQVIPGVNPKLAALLELIDNSPGEKVIIWAKFTAEIELISAALRLTYGEDSTVDFYGKVAKAQRTKNRLSFQKGEARFFVGQPQAGGMGLTLTAAHQVVYYSNDFNLESRVQSEDRAHRIGQTKNVVYTDIVAKGTIDRRLLAVLRKKKGLSDLITGDPTLSWI